jgi:arginine metabolism regulation protein II
MEGSMGEFWLHLQGLERLAKQLQQQGKLSPLVDRLITNSTFLSTIADTTTLDLTALPWSNDTPPPAIPYHTLPHSDFILEVTYGITPSLADLMRRIVALSRHISFYVSTNEPFPTALTSACTDLSDAISQWSVDCEPLSRLYPSSNNEPALRMAQKHFSAFVHGLRVYYHTRILPCPPAQMSHYVSQVAQDLMALETIRTQAGYDSNVAATLTWPGFIASCEANKGPDREVWYQWWGGMLRYRIGNIAQLWKVVQEAWALRDEQGSTEVPGWMPVLRRSGKRVLAV